MNNGKIRVSGTFFFDENLIQDYYFLTTAVNYYLWPQSNMIAQKNCSIQINSTSAARNESRKNFLAPLVLLIPNTSFLCYYIFNCMQKITLHSIFNEPEKSYPLNCHFRFFLNQHDHCLFIKLQTWTSENQPLANS